MMHVATFDHQLRADSAADVRFVMEQCAAWWVPCYVGTADVMAYAKAHKMNIEHAARVCRYRFLAHVARRIQAQAVLTAHHADDQAETVLLRLLRGAGSAGLQAMQARAVVPGAHDVPLVRPLLWTTRAELEAYCATHQLTPRHDPTNDDQNFLRNRIRHEIVPLLATINPQIVGALNQTAQIAAQQQAFIEDQLHAQCLSHSHIKERYTLIPRHIFINLHAALQNAAIHHVLAHHVTFEQITHAVTIAEQGQTGSIAEFFDDKKLYVDYEYLILGDLDAYQVDVKRRYPAFYGHIDIKIPGETPLPDNGLHGEWPDLSLKNVTTLQLRTRQNGDIFRSKKLKDVLINWKVPKFVRQTLPLVCIGERVVAILLDNGWQIDPNFNALSNRQDFVNFSWVSRRVMVAKIDGIMYS
jgi:tRNA(Ile)-lysidine synthetase-like protein